MSEDFEIHTNISLLPANEHEAYLEEGFSGICTGGSAVIELSSVRCQISKYDLVTILPLQLVSIYEISNDFSMTFFKVGLPSERDKKGNVIRYTGITLNNTKCETMAQELKEMKDRAGLSDRLKSAFLANMSHEIRTPLNAIVGFSELMIECDDPDEKAEYGRMIESNNELLLRLINDILDLSKIESGILERKRERFSMLQLCDELYMMTQQKMSNPDVDLLQDKPRQDSLVFLDRDRLKQVWMNFLTNAVKCTRSGHIRMGYPYGNRLWSHNPGT